MGGITRERCLEMLRELHQMKLQLDSRSEFIADLNTTTMQKVMVKRNGSIRGRKNLVKNALLKMTENLEISKGGQKQKMGANSGVVIYLTSCGVLRKSFEKCKIVIQLLEVFRVKFEIRDLNISPDYIEELAEKLKLTEEIQRDLVFDSLPLVYVDGHFLGNEKTIVELNEAKVLEKMLSKYKTTSGTCSECGNRGYVVCRICHGSRRHPSMNRPLFGLQLKCSFCDVNGISRCSKCCDRTRVCL